jgi:hypothetical protein
MSRGLGDVYKRQRLYRETLSQKKKKKKITKTIN